MKGVFKKNGEKQNVSIFETHAVAPENRKSEIAGFDLREYLKNKASYFSKMDPEKQQNMMYLLQGAGAMALLTGGVLAPWPVSHLF